MEVYQYYYTSHIQQRTGRAGFQVKAMSPGISAELQALLMRHIGYRLPSSCDPSALETHPISLRYFSLPSGQGILLCSQSSGKDEYGRPGNFFTHAIGWAQGSSLPDFTSIPPVFFWKSPFWQVHDPEERHEIASLPTLASFDEEPTLEIEHVWRFLDQGDRRTLLYKLLCAVVHNNTTQRRIVIFDKDEHVALWIATISCLLPPEYRPLLSFATYHHDPQQAQYLITGTIKHSSALISLENSPSYFILDAETGRTGQTEPSAYAELAVQATRSDLYETRMLPIFANLARRFPRPKRIDEQLDQIALYARALSAPSESRVRSSLAGDLPAYQAIHIALSSFESLATYAQEDIDELCQIEQVLRRCVGSSIAGDLATLPEQTVSSDYQRVLALLQTHRASSFKRIVLEALSSLAEELLQEQKNAAIHMTMLHQFYDEQIIVEAINSSSYLIWFTQRIQAGCSVRGLIYFWTNLGNFIRPSLQSQPLLRACFARAGELLDQQDAEAMEALLSAMAQAMSRQQYECLQLSVASYDDFPLAILKALYRFFVAPLSLEERVRYRKLVSEYYPDVLRDELLVDMHSAESSQRLFMLERWIEHARSQHYPTEPLMLVGINELWQACPSEEEWRFLVSRLLLDEHLVPLPQSIENALVPLALASLSLAHFTPDELAICEKYRDVAALPSTTRTQAANIIALTGGCITSEQARQVGNEIERFTPEQYTALLERCLPRFFLHNVSDEAHINLIEALLPGGIQFQAQNPKLRGSVVKPGGSVTDYFWEAYLWTLGALYEQPSSTNKALEMLDFWFRASPRAFTKGYPVQEFFLFFSVSEMMQENFTATTTHEKGMAIRPWYRAIQTMLEGQGRRHSFTLFDDLLKRRANRQAKELSEEQEKSRDGKKAGKLDPHVLDAEMRKFFAGMEDIKQYSKLADLYTASSPEQFWFYYWKHFGRLLAARDADKIFALLSFWFEDAYEVLEGVPYITQEFFLGLPTALRDASKARNFEQFTRELSEKARQEGNGALSDHWFSFFCEW